MSVPSNTNSSRNIIYNNRKQMSKVLFFREGRKIRYQKNWINHQYTLPINHQYTWPIIYMFSISYLHTTISITKWQAWYYRWFPWDVILTSQLTNLLVSHWMFYYYVRSMYKAEFNNSPNPRNVIRTDVIRHISTLYQ